jgi:hypothetical protein
MALPEDEHVTTRLVVVVFMGYGKEMNRIDQ